MKEWLRETHGPYFELLRHFLRNFFASDLVKDPRQTNTVLIGVVPVLFQWFFLLIAPLRGKYADLSALATPGRYRDAVRADELWLITLMMGCIGLLTAIKWQALFPDLRDYRALGTLPLCARQIFGAKLAALLLIAGATLLMLNFLPSVAFPAISGSRWAIDSSFSARFLAHLGASLAGCSFLFFAMIAVQGVLLNVLRPRTFRRVTGFLQGALVAAMLAMIVVSFSIQPPITNELMRPEWARWAPPVWFLGLYEKLSGNHDPVMGARAHLALVALIVAVALTFLSYLISYHRHRTLLIEGMNGSGKGPRFTDLLPGWLFSDPRQQAVAAFMWQTLTRSSHHRMIIMGYGGLSLAIILTGLIGMDKVVPPERVITAEFLYFHVIAFLFLAIGTRHLFSIPTELKANWIFQITEHEGRGAWLTAVDRFVLFWGVLLMVVIPFPFEMRLLGWRGVAETALMIAVGLLVYERIFFVWEKLPFTCSRLAGQTPIGLILAFLGLIGAVAVLQSLLLEIVYNNAAIGIVLGILLIACAYTHKRRREDWGTLSLKYEDVPEPAVHGLNLLK